MKETANRGSAGRPDPITYTYDFPKAAVTWEKVSTGVWYSSDGFLTNARGSHESCKKLCAADANCGCYTGYNGWCQTYRTCTGTEKKTGDPSAVTYRKVADAAVPEPFADSAALKTAVDNCLTAVPSGLDCCKPKSEGGGGADCGAGGHAAIGDWDTSKVTSMNRLFCDCANGNNWCGGVKINRASFNQPIGKWDTSKVTDMDRMFHGQAWNGGTSAFNQPIGDWDVSKVTNMFQMFAYTTAFNQPLDSWDTSSVTNYEYMFVKAKAFNQDISGWKLPRTYRAMFSGADALTLAYYPYPYHPEAKAAAEAAKPKPFADSAAFKTAVENCLTAVPSGLDCCKPKSEGGGGADCGAGGHAAIGDWDVSQVTDMNHMFLRTSFNQPIGDWDTSRVTNMHGMFGFTTAFNQPIGNWDTSKVTTMKYMFVRAKVFDQDISGWDTSKVTNKSGMFLNAAAYNAKA